MSVWAFVREVLVTCRSQGVTSTVLGLIAAVSVGLVLGTAGLSAAAQSKVLSTVDQVGTRSVAVYSKDSHKGLPSGILDSLERLDIVESAVGFSETTDVTNVSFTGGKRVALRLVYGQLGEELAQRATQLGLPEEGAPLVGFATADAFDVLGLPPEGGGVRVVNEGVDVSVIGALTLPEHLEKLSPTILAPVEQVESLSVMYLSTRVPSQVPLLTELLRGELRDFTSEDHTIETSQAYADLRAAIDGELTASSHTLILSVLGAGAGATMLVVWSVVLLRRKDLGRRRALGASRLMIVGLMMGQVAVLTLVGACVGALTTAGVMSALEHPLAPAEFTSAISIALASASTLLAVIPALWAANRDPLTELRVP